MKYIGLLRGINISGKNQIKMNELKSELELLGYRKVLTYLNSGNIIFESNLDDKIKIATSIKCMIKEKFNLNIPVYILKEEELQEIIANSPKWWNTKDKEIYDNIIFILPPLEYSDVYNKLGEINKNIEREKRYHNVIFLSYKLKDYRKSAWWKKSATVDIKDSITIRTANTVVKLASLASENNDKQ